jgi:hypothetical protein
MRGVLSTWLFDEDPALQNAMLNGDNRVTATFDALSVLIKSRR